LSFAAFDKTQLVAMDEFVTRAELRTLGIDPRTAIKRHGLTPDATLKVGERLTDLYRADRIALLASLLGEAQRAAKNSKD
jgi:hypothetical protein